MPDTLLGPLLELEWRPLPADAPEPGDGHVVGADDGRLYSRRGTVWVPTDPDGTLHDSGPWWSWEALAAEHERLLVPAVPEPDQPRRLGARGWWELLLTVGLFFAASAANLDAVRHADWNWNAPISAVMVYATLLLSGWALEFLLCGWVARALVDVAVTAGRWWSLIV